MRLGTEGGVYNCGVEEQERGAETLFDYSFTVIFLLDAENSGKLMMLKRAGWKKIAPNMYTGVGGTIEEETVMENAHRELQEETGFTGVELYEFARCIIFEKSTAVYYFWGIYPGGDLPECDEGELEWADFDSLGGMEIIPTTKMVLEEWGRRGFAVDRPWTLIARPLNNPNVYMARELVAVIEGLV